MPAVLLDRLHYFAQYLEQSIVFGKHDGVIQQQMDVELKGVNQSLTKTQIRQLTQHMLASSTLSVSSQEINSLYALQSQKDLYGTLRSIVLATHQRTGALTGRIGVHTRIAAETELNATTNTDAVKKVLEHVQPGSRMSVMDMVKASGDEGKLHDPDVFETNTYGQHRNGLVDNHAWNLQKLVRAIRDGGFQDRVILAIRIDGPDAGANVNVFDANTKQRYELAIFKLIRYLEAMLPAVPFKIALGNEPDLFKERQWSDPSADPRTYTLNQFAPAMGAFMKKLARQRPDVTFMCPALSAILKYDYLSYYTAFFGDERPENLIPCMHGYSADVQAMPGGQRNLVEQQAEALRAWGGFRHVSGTEIGSGNPFADCEALSEKGHFDDVIAWILLSTDHITPPEQDNNWNFRINPGIDDPTARHLADIINRTQARVLRNIRERGGVGLQIMSAHIVDRPAYAVEYVDHNTPTTMIAGQTNAVRVTIRNTSYRTWPAGGVNQVRLGYHWYTSDGRDVPSSLWEDNRASLPYDLRPGHSLSLNCNLSAPRTSGTYDVRWDMVEEMRTWFAWQGVPTLNVRVAVNADISVIPPAPAGMSVSASHNNRQQGFDNVRQAIDNNPYTRWSTLQPQRPGMWFQIDLGQVRTLSQVRLDNEPSPLDYPRGYIVKVSRDGHNWTTVADNPLNDRPLNVTFSPRQVRFIRIEQTGSDPVFWWSIHEIGFSGEVRPSASASHNNVLVGADN
ncbi:MAG: discoidin domain-containing protein, partial [Anaerolineae bacterium]